MNSLVDEMTLDIMRAFFAREPDNAANERVFTASPADNEDLARAALRSVKKYLDARVRGTQEYAAVIDLIDEELKSDT